MKILFTGGGTGGHIFPIIAVARELRRIYTGKENLQLFYMGPKDEFGDLALSQEGIQVFHVLSGKLRRYGGIEPVIQSIVDIFFKIPLGIFQAFLKIFFLAPDMIFSKGGYGSLPVTIGGWLLGTPIFLHESDLVPGLSNRISALFAIEIFVSFPRTLHIPQRKMMVVGNPIRRELLTGSREEAARLFHLQNDKLVLLILGGSQGAQRINDSLLAILNDALSLFEIIHQTGEKNFSQVKAEAQVVMKPPQEKYYHPVPFLNEVELRHAYAAADMIIGRAGSGTIFEIAALGKPAILIPLTEAAQRHQLLNAYEYAKTKAAIVLEEANITPHFLLERIKYFFSHLEELDAMGKAALEFARPEAAKIIAYYLVEYLKRE